MMLARFACVCVLASSSSQLFAQGEEQRSRQAYLDRLSLVSASRIRRHISELTKPATRIAGSSGERRALEYAEAQFRSFGLVNIRREPFTVSIPDPEARGTLSSPPGAWSVQVLPLWPNLVRTSTCHVQGRLVYGGHGTLEDLAGKAIAGSIVLMEFDSKGNWRNAIKLGAAAVVFLEPDEARRSQAEAKFSSIPLTAPRFWLSRRFAGPALSASIRGDTVRLDCRQDWVNRETYNVLADLPGRSEGGSGERILISAFADSISVVPSLSPGAQEATGLAALLELARIAKLRPGIRPITFMASSAHFLGLQGAREFVARRLEVGQEPLLLSVSLDLSSGSPTLGSYSQGWFYEYRNEAWDVVRALSRTLRSHADWLLPLTHSPNARMLLTDAVNDGDGRTWRNNIPGKFAFDCEPFTQARYNALTFATIDEARAYVDTPSNTLDRVDVSNVAQQTRTLACMLWHFQNDSTRKGDLSPLRLPIEVTSPQSMSLVGGFAMVSGRVVEFDPLKSFVPDVSVPNALVASLHGQKTMLGVRGNIVQIVSAPRAEYRLIGCAPISSWIRTRALETRLAAFQLDPDSGNIRFAPSKGMLGSEIYNPAFLLKTSSKSTPIVVFRCVSTDLYDLSDPQELKALYDPRVLEAASDAEPTHYGFFQPGQDQRLTSDIEDAAVLFTQPAFRWKLMMGTGFGESRLILTNSDSAHPAGRGYISQGATPKNLAGRDSAGAGGLVAFLPLQTASDIATLNRDRLNRFAKYRIISPSVDGLQTKAEASLKDAAAAIERKDWPSAERNARSAWGYALRAHPVIQGTANDVVTGVVFYLFLLIPFSFFVERLLFAGRSMVRQLIVGGLVFFGSFGLLRAIHPAFEIVSNPSMVFVAFIMGTLSIIVIGFIVGKFEASLKLIQAAQTGVHEVDIGRFSVALAAFNLGVSNMRRRRARTFLTTLTLILMTFIVLSFTSVVPDLKINEVPNDAAARYPGILVRNPGLEPLQNSTAFILENLFAGQAAVARRAWYYGADIIDSSAFSLQRGDRIVNARAVLGLDPAEAGVSRPQEALLKGSRWFRPGDSRAMILPRSVAEQLGVDESSVGIAEVGFEGERYQVVGIIDDAQVKSISDLDGDGILPADFALSKLFQTETRSSTDAFRKFLRLDPSICVLLPTDAALELGAELRSVAIGFANPEASRRALDELMPRTRLNIYASVPGDGGMEVRMFSVLQGSKSSGLVLVVIQMLIASIFVLNTMIASVYERKREIGIFSAVGLAPNHIAILFFAESLVYGVLGAVLGYFAAQFAARTIIATGALPGLYLNFSATSAVLSATVVLGVVLLSTIYPARVAARIAAPALDEELMNQEPEGDRWEMVLPFSLGPDEAVGLIRFLDEWFRAYEAYTIGDFVTSGTQVKGVDGGPNISTPSVSTTVWPAPYDLGVSQLLEISASPTELPRVFRVEMVIERLSGDPANWTLVNRRFLEHLRRQFLTWRTLDLAKRSSYIHSASEPAHAS